MAKFGFLVNPRILVVSVVPTTFGPYLNKPTYFSIIVCYMLFDTAVPLILSNSFYIKKILLIFVDISNI